MQVTSVVAVIRGTSGIVGGAAAPLRWPETSPGERVIYVLGHCDSPNGDPLDEKGAAPDATFIGPDDTAARLTGYEVVWRESTEPNLTHSVDVGKALTARVPVSKDDCFLVVRAYTAAGFHSLVSPALAGRE